MRTPDLLPILSPIRWAAVGAIAARLYMPERATVDFDILVAAPDAEEVMSRLARAGFQDRGSLAFGGRSWQSPEGEALDLLVSEAPWCLLALEQAQENRDPHGVPILPLPFLVLMKFEASRVQDLADITRMLGQAPPEALEQVRAVFRRWIPEGLDDLESLIALGQLEFQRHGDSPTPSEDT